MSKCHRSVISLKYFFAVLQSRLHKEFFWLVKYYKLTFSLSKVDEASHIFYCIAC